LQISELIDDIYLPRWEECPEVPGFAVLLRLPDASRGFVLAVKALKESGEEAGDVPPEISLYLVKYAVADWRGLTVGGLRRLTALPVAGDDSQEIPFNQENLESLLRISQRFFLWALQTISARLTAAKREAAAIENLSDTPNTTPIPTP